MNTFKKIASSILAGIIFVTVPSILAASLAGYKELTEIGVYAMIVISVPYYFLNREKYSNNTNKA